MGTATTNPHRRVLVSAHVNIPADIQAANAPNGSPATTAGRVIANSKVSLPSWLTYVPSNHGAISAAPKTMAQPAATEKK